MSSSSSSSSSSNENGNVSVMGRRVVLIDVTTRGRGETGSRDHVSGTWSSSSNSNPPQPRNNNDSDRPPPLANRILMGALSGRTLEAIQAAFRRGDAAALPPPPPPPPLSHGPPAAAAAGGASSRSAREAPSVANTSDSAASGRFRNIGSISFTVRRTIARDGTTSTTVERTRPWGPSMIPPSDGTTSRDARAQSGGLSNTDIMNQIHSRHSRLSEERRQQAQQREPTGEALRQAQREQIMARSRARTQQLAEQAHQANRATRFRALRMRAMSELPRNAPEPERRVTRSMAARPSAGVETRAARRRRLEAAPPPVDTDSDEDLPSLEPAVPHVTVRRHLGARVENLEEARPRGSRATARSSARATRSNAAAQEAPPSRRRRRTVKPPPPPRTLRPRKAKRKMCEQPALENCCICMSEPQPSEQSAINGCSHKFCFGCIEQWADRENTCPLCKERFTKISKVQGGQGGKRTKSVHHRTQRSELGHALLQGLFPGAASPHLARLIVSELDRMGERGPIRITRVNERWLHHAVHGGGGGTAENPVEIDE